MDCIDLRQRFGKKYRVKYEESYYAERGDGARSDAPWLQIIPCQHGHIYPFGGEMLAASTDTRGPIAKRLVRLACTAVVQDGDDGVNASFHVDDFDQIAEIIKPRKRRRRSMSEEDKKRLAEMGRAALLKLHGKTSQSDPDGQICDVDMLVDSRAVPPVQTPISAAEHRTTVENCAPEPRDDGQVVASTPPATTCRPTLRSPAGDRRKAAASTADGRLGGVPTGQHGRAGGNKAEVGGTRTRT